MKKNIKHFYFFSETIETFESKLGWNMHWMVLYKMCVFMCRSEIQDDGHCMT